MLLSAHAWVDTLVSVVYKKEILGEKIHLQILPSQYNFSWYENHAIYEQLYTSKTFENWNIVNTLLGLSCKSEFAYVYPRRYIFEKYPNEIRIGLDPYTDNYDNIFIFGNVNIKISESS